MISINYYMFNAAVEFAFWNPLSGGIVEVKQRLLSTECWGNSRLGREVQGGGGGQVGIWATRQGAPRIQDLCVPDPEGEGRGLLRPRCCEE